MNEGKQAITDNNAGNILGIIHHHTYIIESVHGIYSLLGKTLFAWTRIVDIIIIIVGP